ncbi:MAG: spermidine synthase [Actinomycetota bacterium]
MAHQYHNWQAANLAAIQQRLAWLQEQPDGIIFCQPSGSQYVVVRKNRCKIRVALVDKIKLQTDLVQSVFYFDNPFYLVSEYTQAMMLSLVWQNAPKKVYIAGFGGGRIPFILHHYFPEVTIECAEIDSTTIAVATKFFGVQLDERLKVTIQDGREFLEQQTPEIRYDIIMLDAFFGNGYLPYKLTTKEFYQLCEQHLTESGILVANFLQRDQFYPEQVKTIQSVFSQVSVCLWKNFNSVIFATSSGLISEDEILVRANSLQEQYQFPFPLLERVKEVKVGKEWAECLPNWEQAEILRDHSPPEGYFNCWLF